MVSQSAIVKPNSDRTSCRGNRLVVLEPLMGFGDSLAILFGEWLVIERSVRQLAGKRVEHDFHDMHDRRDLIGRQVIQQLLGVLSVCVHSWPMLIVTWLNSVG